MKKIHLDQILPAIGFLLLILDARTALSGARDGIELCTRSIIPSIFPFLVLSTMLMQGLVGGNLGFLRPLGVLLSIPKGAESIFLCGLLGGYPTGAQAVHQAWQNGQISKNNAQRMLAFCSNAGPSFLFGILGSMFSKVWMSWALWGIHILSAIMVGMILPVADQENTKTVNANPITMTEALKKGVVTMGYICGWVVLFRMILAFLDRWFLWHVPAAVRVGIYGVLELANGCCALLMIENEGLRFILASGLLAFGGICVGMQTASVADKLGMGKYWIGKGLQTIFSLGIACLFEGILVSNGSLRVTLTGLLLAIFIAFFFKKQKIRGRNPALLGV